MIEELNMVEKFCKKYGFHYSKNPTLLSTDKAYTRYELLREELDEYMGGNIKRDLANVAKELKEMEETKPCQMMGKLFDKWSKTMELVTIMRGMQAANAERILQNFSLAYSEDAIS